jgi:hypothetical protein
MLPQKTLNFKYQERDLLKVGISLRNGLITQFKNSILQFQNETLQILADLILGRIQQDCIASWQFGVIVDKISYNSRHEKVSMHMP